MNILDIALLTLDGAHIEHRTSTLVDANTAIRCVITEFVCKLEYELSYIFPHLERIITFIGDIKLNAKNSTTIFIDFTLKEDKAQKCAIWFESGKIHATIVFAKQNDKCYNEEEIKTKHLLLVLNVIAQLKAICK